MANQNNNGTGINRRDFLRLGGLTAGALGVATVVARIGEFDIVASEEEYGGFYIRKHDAGDKPYEVDEASYRRADQRSSVNPMVLSSQETSALAKLANFEDGYTRYECALHSSAWTVATAQNTGGIKGNSGLYSWDVLPGAIPAGGPRFYEVPRWNPADDGLSTDDVTQIIKKTARFYGASLVGVTHVDERWFYDKIINLDTEQLLNGGGMPQPQAGDISASVTVVQDALLSMDAEEMKAALVIATENIDPSLLPDGVSVASLDSAPAAMFQQMLPTVLPTFRPEYLAAIVVEIPSEFLPEEFEPSSILEETFEVGSISEMMPFATITFDDVSESRHDNDGVVISKDMKHVIVMAFEMDHDGIMTEHGMIPESAVAMGYSKMAFTAASLAQFIRDLGYNAVPMGNDTSLSVPMAIDAGLGELSRAGYMITPKYGSRVRIAKVLTDLPLTSDRPISFGVTEFCEICGKCADQCPSGAISKGERSFEAPETGNPGVLKWAIEGANCQQYWADSGVSCSICIKVCPFNKPEGWLHDATRILIGAKSGSIDNILLRLDDASGYGESISPEEFWQRDNHIHIKSD